MYLKLAVFECWIKHWLSFFLLLYRALNLVPYQYLLFLLKIAISNHILCFQPLQILNGNLFPKPIRIQLVDAAGNVTNDKNVRCILQRDANLKVCSSLLGHLSFTIAVLDLTCLLLKCNSNSAICYPWQL